MLDAEQQSCKSKCRYTSPPSEAERKGWLRYYHCHLCDGYHLTSRGAKRVKKTEKLKCSRSNYVIKWTFALPTGQREAEQMLS